MLVSASVLECSGVLVGNLLKTGSQFLEAQRKLHMTDEVTYRRGIHSVTLQATQGKSDYTAYDDNGFEVQSQVTDFLITTADLILNSAMALPEMDDKIVTGLGTFAVLHLGDAGCWRYSDPYGATLRVHTKLIT